ncbi:MAG: hypothetical protein M1813_005934 [Trichoglossum hirsutum]|nr:MAG: hypothetical protein M1813_005934 [Trichoglossum hirsutum]
MSRALDCLTVGREDYARQVGFHTRPGSSRRSAPDILIQSAKFRRDFGVKCNNFLIGNDDLSRMEQGLVTYFGAGKDFHKQYSAESGSAVAFACGYGKDQSYTGQQVVTNMAAIESVRGPLGADWSVHSGSKSTYGRTQNSASFC